MLFFEKKPSISQKACCAETGSRKVSPAVSDTGSRAVASLASSLYASGVPGGRVRRASGVAGNAADTLQVARSHAEQARWSKMALAVALRWPDAPLAPRGGRSARRRGTISPIFLACVATL